MNESLIDDDPLFPEAEVKFATFWPRLGAGFLDGIIILLFTVPITYFNITNWKIPSVYILTCLISIPYKPLMEYRYGATLGKMAVGLKVVGRNFDKVTWKEEMRRVSFYLIPSIFTAFLELRNYFSADFISIKDYREYNQYIVSSNPAISWLNGIIIILLVADCITFFSNFQRRALHDVYAGTYVIERDKN